MRFICHMQKHWWKLYLWMCWWILCKWKDLSQHRWMSRSRTWVSYQCTGKILLELSLWRCVLFTWRLGDNLFLNCAFFSPQSFKGGFVQGGLYWRTFFKISTMLWLAGNDHSLPWTPPLDPHSNFDNSIEYFDSEWKKMLIAPKKPYVIERHLCRTLP